MQALHVDLEEVGLRLDKLLAQRFPGYSRTYFQFLIQEGAVLLNGQPCKKRTLLAAEDEVEVAFLLTPELSVAPEPIPLEILFEDEHILAINKPVGMVVHPAPGHPNGTFVNALLHHCQTIAVEEGNLRPGIVHRLDRDTSGLLLAAKHQKAHTALVELFASRAIDKRYWALAVGKPPEGLLQASIGRHPRRRTEMCVDLVSGKPATSEIRILATTPHLSLAEVKLITGRTHQIRVHLQHLGTPVLGDPVYGSASANQRWGEEAGQLLHARELCFSHPITGEAIHLVAPLPLRLEQALHRFGLTLA